MEIRPPFGETRFETLPVPKDDITPEGQGRYPNDGFQQQRRSCFWFSKGENPAARE